MIPKNNRLLIFLLQNNEKIFFLFLIIVKNGLNGDPTSTVANISSNIHKILCRGKDTMTIYSLLAIYTWVLIEGAYLHSLVLTAFHNGGGVQKMKYFAPFGQSSKFNY